MGYENRDYHRDDARPDIRFTMPTISPLFLGIAGASLVIFILQGATGPGFGPVVRALMLNYNGGQALWQPWRFITYQYVHGDALHLFFNMLPLYAFLPWLESLWGRWKTFAFYTLGGIAGAVAFGLLGVLLPQYFSGMLIGASGSVLAVIGACGLFFGDRPISVFFVPMTMRGLAALAGLFFLLSTFADRQFNDAAHLGGLAFGYYGPYLAGPTLRNWQEARATRRRVRDQQYEIDEQAEIDRILAKVSASGMHSLTRGEQRTLKNATARQRAATTPAPKKPTATFR